MGNLMSSCIARIKSGSNHNINDSLADSRRLLLMENMEEKIEKLEIDMSTKYSNMIMTYNKEINNLRMEINVLGKENEKIVRKVNDLNVLIEEKQENITLLENKIYNMESHEEFLSTVDEENGLDAEEVFRT